MSPNIPTIPNVNVNVDADIPAEKIYDDLLSPSSKSWSTTLALLPRTINALLTPYQKWLLNKEYEISETTLLLEKKLINVDPCKLVAPEPYVVVPALQAISYCMDSEELRNMYANLLASAINCDSKDDVHVAFVDIIKQLMPREAILLKTIFDCSGVMPLVQLRANKTSVGEISTFGSSVGFTLVENYTPIENLEIFDEDVNKLSSSFINLKRLGLIYITYSAPLDDCRSYDKFQSDLFITEATQHYRPDYEIKVTRGHCRFTAFGKSFVKVCL